MSVVLSVVMPCLNEAETLAICIKKAETFFIESGIAGEVLIADNGSTDGSQEIAKNLNACVINVSEKGYGAALRAGITASKGKYVIMGDADDSYDFSDLSIFIAKLEEGNDLVMGNRFEGGISKGAMPFLHKYLGNPVLSFIGRLFFKIPVGDFHCGLRGFTKDAFNKMELRTSGMEFASEMVVKASLLKMKITEVPIKLHKDGRTREPHLNTWTDGWRHLRFLLLYSPTWLFFVPGILLILSGLVLTGILLFQPIHIGTITLDVHTLLFSSFFILIGFQFILFYGLTKVYTVENGLLPKSTKYDRLFHLITLEKGLVLGFLLFFLGLGLALYAYFFWKDLNFGNITNRNTLKVVIASGTTMLLGVQTILFSFFFSILGLKNNI
jgi:glycosyltransferase involved in cell wall biosynthesis